MDGSETVNGGVSMMDGEEGYRYLNRFRANRVTLNKILIIIVTITRELFNKLDGEHAEEEKEEGKPIVCKKHLGLSLRAINENIDENPEVCISCISVCQLSVFLCFCISEM